MKWSSQTVYKWEAASITWGWMMWGVEDPAHLLIGMFIILHYPLVFVPVFCLKGWLAWSFEISRGRNKDCSEYCGRWSQHHLGMIFSLDTFCFLSLSLSLCFLFLLSCKAHMKRANRSTLLFLSMLLLLLLLVVVRVDQQAFVRQVDHLSCFSLSLYLCVCVCV